MSEKVKVSREVANFIQAYEENVASYPGWKDDLICEHSEAWSNGFEDCKKEAECMKDITPYEVAIILVNGYEVEKSPEEKVRCYYDAINDLAKKLNDPYDSGSVAAIKETLNLLGIKIKGVND